MNFFIFGKELIEYNVISMDKTKHSKTGIKSFVTIYFNGG